MSILKLESILKKDFLLDIKCLLYVMDLLRVDENGNNEQLFGNKMQNILLQFGMVCSIGTVYVRNEDNENKRKHFKTICIIEKGKGSYNERQTRRNKLPLDTKWNFEALCHASVRKAKIKYNNYIQEMSPIQK